MSAFRISQQVVCVNDNWDHPMLEFVAGSLPVKGRVYTVDGFDDKGWLKLLGFASARLVPFGEAMLSFRPDCFRPVVRTDISIFTAMLDRAPTKRERETTDA